MFDHRQWRAAGIPFLPHTVTGPVTGPVNASSSVVVSTGSAPAAARSSASQRRLADHQQRQGAGRAYSESAAPVEPRPRLTSG